MTKHTPGPWLAYNEADCPATVFVIVGPENEHIATLSDTAQSAPDARLIAQAPRLLAALKDMTAGWRYIRRHHGDLYGVGWDRCEIEARAAIAAAEGKG